MVTRADVEAKARELEAAFTQTKDSARNTTVLAGVAVAILVVVAFLIGRHRRGKTVVEVYKL
jgi:ABC-type Fe3+ transport system permease subunit